jgi:hypothetical protein
MGDAIAQQQGTPTPRKKHGGSSGAAAAPSGVTLLVLTKEAVVARLKKRPPASFLVWAESVAAAECPDDHPGAVTTVSRSTTVSMKLHGAIWHEPLDLPIKIKCKRGRAQSCKVDQRVFAQVKRLQTEFMPRLQAVITEIVSDRNYVERDLLEAADIRKELRFRKCLLFPCGCDGAAKFVVHKISRHGVLESLDIVPNVKACTLSYTSK